jgi:hypothetical protein
MAVTAGAIAIQKNPSILVCLESTLYITDVAASSAVLLPIQVLTVPKDYFLLTPWKCLDRYPMTRDYYMSRLMILMHFSISFPDFTGSEGPKKDYCFSICSSPARSLASAIRFLLY